MIDLRKFLNQMKQDKKVGQMMQVTFSEFTHIPKDESTGEDKGTAKQGLKASFG